MEHGRLSFTSRSDALMRPGPVRAESIRAAAQNTFFELDSGEASRRALVSRSRRNIVPFDDGTIVYF